MEENFLIKAQCKDLLNKKGDYKKGDLYIYIYIYIY